MVEIGSRYEETLKSIVDDVEIAFSADDSGRSFSDFYRAWREQRTLPAGIVQRKLCYACCKHIDGEHLQVERIETPKSTATYYFHPGCFDELVSKNHAKGSIRG